jgi:hypothetical protein
VRNTGITSIRDEEASKEKVHNNKKIKKYVAIKNIKTTAGKIIKLTNYDYESHKELIFMFLEYKLIR